MTLIDNVPYDPGFDPTETRRFNKRLYSKPAFMTPAEKALDGRLRTHMVRHVKPYLNSQRAVDALKAYVHNKDLFKKFTQYSFAPKKHKKPRGFDACQRALTSPGIRRGATEDLTLYRCISQREMDGAFHLSEDWYTDEHWKGTKDEEATADSIFFINRNVSTSISPIAAIKFLSAKDPGHKCCMLVFKIPKGYPYIYMPGLFPRSGLVMREREVYLPSGEYYAEEIGYEVKLHFRTLRIDPGDMEDHAWKNKTSAIMRVMVVRPRNRYSPFISGPKTLYKIPYLRKQLYAKAIAEGKGFEESTKTEPSKPGSDRRSGKKKVDQRKVKELIGKLEAIYGYKVKVTKA